MNIIQVYDKQNTPTNLREHMLRVASFAKILCDNWTQESLNKDAIISACTLHDIAKPMTFDISKQAGYGMPQNEIDNLEKWQNETKTKYGESEHQATVGICKDSGMKVEAINLVDNLEWKYIPKLLLTDDIESLIPIYCDMRVGTKGVLTLQERLDDLKKRVNGDDYEDNVKNGKELEEVIRKNVKIDLNSITDEQINSQFENLLNLEV